MTSALGTLARIGLLLLLGAVPALAESSGTTLKNLQSYWSAARGDSLTTTANGQDSAMVQAGYRRVRKEGTIFGRELPTTRELALYRHPSSGRHVLAANPTSRARAEAEGHVLVRIEGHVLAQREDGTRALELYWHPQDKDYLTTASVSGARSAKATGYEFLRIEGWLPGVTMSPSAARSAPSWSKELAAAVAEDHEALSLYWNAVSKDYLTTSENTADRAKGLEKVAQVALVRREAATRGTVPLVLYWHEERQDHLLVASPDGIQGAELVGYEVVGTVGHGFPSAQVGTVPLELYWSASRRDYLSIPAGTKGVDLSGYHLVRTEAHVFGPSTSG